MAFKTDNERPRIPTADELAMPDFAKCESHECPIRKKCLRYTVKPGEWHSYCDFYDDSGKECKFLMEIEK